VAFSISNGTAAWKFAEAGDQVAGEDLAAVLYCITASLKRLAREGDLFSVEVSSSLSCIMGGVGLQVGVGSCRAMNLLIVPVRTLSAPIRPFIASPLPGSLATLVCAETAVVARRDHRLEVPLSCLR